MPTLPEPLGEYALGEEGNNLLPSLLDTLSLSETATCVTIRLRQVSDTISLIEDVQGERVEPSVTNAVAGFTIQGYIKKPTDNGFILAGYLFGLGQDAVEIEREANDTLTISETVTNNLLYSRIVNDTISLSEPLVVNKSNYLVLNDTLVLNENVVATNNLQVVTDTITLNDAATVFVSHNEAITDTISLNETTAVGLETNKTATDTINLVETVLLNSVRQQIVSDTINLNENVALKRAIAVPTVTDTITIQEHVSTIPQQDVVDTILFTETVTFIVSKHAQDTLVLTEAVIAAGTYNRSVTDTLSLGESLIGKVFKYCNADFNPSPGLGIRNQTTFSYPYTSPTIIVNLRNPNFDNVHRQDMNSVVRRTRGGKQVNFREATWLKFDYLQLQFEGLSRAQADSLIELLEVSAADELKLIDWENRTWKGFIISDPNEVIEGIDDGCHYTASLKFEGVLQ